MKAIVPFKKEGAKSRLGHFLSEGEREELAENMLKDVLVALFESELEEVEIISTGAWDGTPQEAQVAGVLDAKSNSKPRLKLEVIEDERGLNEALNEAIAREKEPVLILMADVPLTTPEGINELLKHGEDVVIVPGRKGGTNALFLRRPDAFFLSYYGVSFSEHIETARQRNLSLAVYDSFFISTDIDEVEDLIELLVHGSGFSADYLRSIGVCLHVDKNLKTRARVVR